MPYRYADNTSTAVPPSIDGIVEIESTNLARRIREAELEYGFEIGNAREFSTAGCFNAGLTDGESWMWKMWAEELVQRYGLDPEEAEAVMIDACDAVTPERVAAPGYR